VAAQTWLRTNARAVLFASAVPLVTALIATLLVTGLPGHAPPVWLRLVGLALLVVSLSIVAVLVWQSRRPRLAYRDKHLLVWLRSENPIAVPIEAVECFWLGQAPTLLPGKRNERSEAAAVVVRIADAATEWQHQEVDARLGKWCDGYITIRGTWCEPLNVDVVQRLNERLAEVTRAPTTS
jgi:hypothetical protein